MAHKALGHVWVGAMGVVAMSGFWIHEFQWFGPFSIIHVLSLLVFATLIYVIRAIRRGGPRPPVLRDPGGGVRWHRAALTLSP
ncbi:hypothetical protein [Mameliella sp. MMSF_3552]|uniref:hypothetical protein n=1 Tax=unclassified Mameliella TaxID=2630630 RepID=UPI003531C2D5